MHLFYQKYHLGLTFENTAEQLDLWKVFNFIKQRQYRIRISLNLTLHFQALEIILLIVTGVSITPRSWIIYQTKRRLPISFGKKCTGWANSALFALQWAHFSLNNWMFILSLLIKRIKILSRWHSIYNVTCNILTIIL